MGLSIAAPLYFSVGWIDDPRSIGLARPLDKGSDFDVYIRRRKRRGGYIDDWIEQHYQLHGCGRFSDYQPEVRGMRLCSERLKEVLDSARGPRDEVQWLPARVTDGDGETRVYWVLNFPESTEDLLDIDRTRYGPFDEAMRAVIDVRKAAGREVFAPPEGSSVSFVVSAGALAKIQAARCEGLEIIRYPTSDGSGPAV